MAGVGRPVIAPPLLKAAADMAGIQSEGLNFAMYTTPGHLRGFQFVGMKCG